MMTRPTERRDISGIILIDKPSLLTSNAVLQQVKRLFSARKAGHMGSLDPLATGMLPICFGEATKFAHYGLEADKCYIVTAKFGIQTDTGDSQGQAVATVDAQHLSRVDVEQQLPAFLGDSLQIPPMYSALKHQGRKLYEFARAGVDIVREPRPITIRTFELLAFDNPCAQFRVHCTKGTYIRTLIEDLGKRLALGAHVVQLHRAYTAGFEKQPMYSLEDLAALSSQERDQCLLPIDFMIQQLPALTLSEDVVHALYQGKIVTAAFSHPSGSMRLYDEAQQFQGLGEWDATTGLLKSTRLIARM